MHNIIYQVFEIMRVISLNFSKNEHLHIKNLVVNKKFIFEKKFNCDTSKIILPKKLKKYFIIVVKSPS